MPETSIIIRTFNEEKHIGSLLRAIKNQDYSDYEIILIDSGSTDRTLDIAKELADVVLHIESRDFTFGYSLNMGCRKSKGKYIVLVSAHVLPQNSHWLSNLLAPFRDEKVAMVYGRQIGAEETKFSEKRDFKRFFSDSPLNSNVFLHYANNANTAIRKELWSQRQFDEYLFGLEDIEWAKHITAKGFLVHYEPKATIYHIHAEKWPQIFNRYRREAIAAVRIGLNHPPQASPSYFWLINNIFQDCLASFPDIALARLEEIGRFRYYQWKGTRQGWFYDKHIDLNREKYTLFYPSANQAVVINSKSKASLQEVSLPEIKPGDVLIKVEYVGVCQTDLEVYDGSLGYYRQGVAKYPIVPGHEFSGTIIQIGSSPKYRERFKIGDRVVGECILSRGGNSERREVGVINYNGAYSQFIVMPGDHLHKIPEEIDLKTACLTEPLAVVLRAIKRIASRLNPKEKMAVIGAGPIGNLCAQVLANLGHQVTVFDKNQERLAFLKNNVEATSQETQNLQDFDTIVEATGEVNVLKSILKNSRTNATVLLLGFPYGSINYNFEDVVGQEKVIIGSVGADSQDFEEALKLLSKIDTSHFNQVVLSLGKFSEAWRLHNSSKYLKIILKPLET